MRKGRIVSIYATIYVPNVSYHLARFFFPFFSFYSPKGAATSNSFSVSSTSRWVGELNASGLKSAPSGAPPSGQGVFALSGWRDGEGAGRLTRFPLRQPSDRRHLPKISSIKILDSGLRLCSEPGWWLTSYGLAFLDCSPTPLPLCG